MVTMCIPRNYEKKILKFTDRSTSFDEVENQSETNLGKEFSSNRLCI